jgi:hypothetical protein
MAFLISPRVTEGKEMRKAGDRRRKIHQIHSQVLLKKERQTLIESREVNSAISGA